VERGSTPSAARADEEENDHRQTHSLMETRSASADPDMIAREGRDIVLSGKNMKNISNT